MVLQKVVPATCSESCPAVTSSCDGDPVVNIKVEEALDTEVVEDLPLVVYPGMKDEHEVSVFIMQYIEFPIVFLISVCLSLHMKQLLGMDFEQSCLSVLREDCVLFHIACGMRLAY
jgi:hypothetical protein